MITLITSIIKIIIFCGVCAALTWAGIATFLIFLYILALLYLEEDSL